MKASFNLTRQLFTVFCSVFILLSLFGCSSKPSEGDAKKIIKQHIKDEAEGRMELISLRKTNGMNDNKLYRLEFEAEIEFLEDGKW